MPNCRNTQYKSVKFNGFRLKSGTLADSCCGLNCGAIVYIENIAYCARQNVPLLIGYEFLEKKDLFNIPCQSSILGIYSVCSRSTLKSWPLKNVVCKYVQLFCGENEYAFFHSYTHSHKMKINFFNTE